MHNKLINGVLAASMAVTALPGMAFAATTGETQVQLEVDSSQLSISVPTTIHTLAKSDGTLQGATNAKFVNESIFDVYGQHYITEETGDVTLVESLTGADQEIAVALTHDAVQHHMGPAAKHSLYDGDLSLLKQSEIPLGVEGAVNANPVTTPTGAFTVEWHFNTYKPGEAPMPPINIQKADSYGKIAWDYSSNNQYADAANLVFTTGDQAEWLTAKFGDGVKLNGAGTLNDATIHVWKDAETNTAYVGPNKDGEYAVQLNDCTGETIKPFCGASMNAAVIDGYLNTSKVTDMRYMFAFNGSLRAIPIAKSFDTSNVTNMKMMFYDAAMANPNFSDPFVFDTSPMANWNTSKVTDMTGIFNKTTAASYRCEKVNLVGLKNWDTSHVTSFYAMLNKNYLTDGSLRYLENWFHSVGSGVDYVCAMESVYTDTYADDIAYLAQHNTWDFSNAGRVGNFLCSAIDNDKMDYTGFESLNVPQVEGYKEMFGNSKMLPSWALV